MGLLQDWFFKKDLDTDTFHLFCFVAFTVLTLSVNCVALIHFKNIIHLLKVIDKIINKVALEPGQRFSKRLSS